MGTAHWTAPEVLNNKRYHFPADIYSFGMVLYEMVCGCVPFNDMIPIAVALAVAVRKEQPKIPNGAHPTLVKLIRRYVKSLTAALIHLVLLTSLKECFTFSKSASGGLSITSLLLVLLTLSSLPECDSI